VRLATSSTVLGSQITEAIKLRSARSLDRRRSSPDHRSVPKFEMLDPCAPREMMHGKAMVLTSKAPRWPGDERLPHTLGRVGGRGGRCRPVRLFGPTPFRSWDGCSFRSLRHGHEWFAGEELARSETDATGNRSRRDPIACQIGISKPDWYSRNLPDSPTFQRVRGGGHQHAHKPMTRPPSGGFRRARVSPQYFPVYKLPSGMGR
jgi:hypothetical protein